MRYSRFLPLLALLLPACEPPSAPDDPVLEARREGAAWTHAAGGGVFDAGVPVHFSFNAIGFGDGSATGKLKFTTELGGQAISFHGRVTCLAVDPVNNRAWIGGVIVANTSTHPSFTGAVHQVGKDIWFRAVDYGNGQSGTVDRTTFVGFEGSAGIITSEEYCQVQIWPNVPPDDRTGPLLNGNIVIN